MMIIIDLFFMMMNGNLLITQNLRIFTKIVHHDE
jgi:hypothetical protein